MNVAFSTLAHGAHGDAPPETIDAPPGVRLIRVPTMEAVTLVGFRAYQEALVDLCTRAPIGLLVTRPPYDFLDDATAARLREAGTRILGFADEETGAPADIFDRTVSPSQVLWATAPVAALPEREPDHEVALVGEADARWHALVERLRGAEMNVIARGPGWAAEEITPAQKLNLYARSAVVLASGADVRTVLENAMLGVYQIAPELPDLRRYFPEDEVPSWHDPEELVSLVEAALADPTARRRAARAARERAMKEHTWAARWPALVGDLAPRESAAPGQAPVFDQLVLAVASEAEGQDQPETAAAYYAEVLARIPDESMAALGLGRCLRDLGRGAEAIEPLRIAAAATPPRLAGRRATSVTAAGTGMGFGRLGIFPPAAEPTCFLLATLVEIGRLDDALAEAAKLSDPALLDAVTRALGGELPPELKDVLTERMVAARKG